MKVRVPGKSSHPWLFLSSFCFLLAIEAAADSKIQDYAFSNGNRVRLSVDWTLSDRPFEVKFIQLGLSGDKEIPLWTERNFTNLMAPGGQAIRSTAAMEKSAAPPSPDADANFALVESTKGRYVIFDDGTLSSAVPASKPFRAKLIQHNGEKFVILSERGLLPSTSVTRLSNMKKVELDTEYHPSLHKAQGNDVTLAGGLLTVSGANFWLELDSYCKVYSITQRQEQFKLRVCDEESEAPKGAWLIRVRDGEVLQVLGKAAAEDISYSGLPYHLEDGMFSMLDVDQAFDINEFDGEVAKAKLAKPAAFVQSSEGGAVDVVKDVEMRFLDLVAHSRANPHQYQEKVDPELIQEMAESLRERRSVIVLGKPGIGKSSAVRAFAREVGLGHVLGMPRTTKIYEVKASLLASGTKYVGESASRASALIETAKATGCIYFIDELHTLSGVGTHSRNANDVTQSFKGPMENKEMVILGTDTAHEFNNSFSKDPAFVERFDQVKMKAPVGEALLEIVKSRLLSEKKSVPSDKLLEEAVKLSNANDLIAAQPRSAINLLARAFSRLKSLGRSDSSLDQAVLKEAAAAKYGFDPAELDRKRIKEKLVLLREGLDNELIGQDAAKDTIVSMWERKYTRVGAPDQANSILFVGPPGVGKSKIAEASADLMGYRKTVIEMNRYARYGTEGDFARAVYGALLEHPFRVIVLDEIEKAHLTVQEAALSMLQTGEFTVDEDAGDGHKVSREVSAKNAVFILTSNAASDLIKQVFKQKGDFVDLELREWMVAGGISPRIVSRIQEVVPMANPTRAEFKKGIEMYLKRTLERESKDKGMNFVLENSDGFVSKMLERYDEDADYRMIKAIMLLIEKSIARAILSSDVDLDLEMDCGKEVRIQWDQNLANPRKRFKSAPEGMYL